MIAYSLAADDHLSAFFNYQMLFILYGRNAQEREACDALDEELKHTTSPRRQPRPKKYIRHIEILVL